MTNQEAFDKAAKHLIQQGYKSIDGGGSCLYRGPNGTKCAIGALIPDEEYRPRMEGCGASDSLVCSTPSLLGLNQGLLEAIQDVHDFHEPETWPRELDKVAAAFGLDASVLAQV